MCLFSADELLGADLEVRGTRIFARADGARQWLAYSMSLAAPGAVAMILPLPVPAGSPEDAATFVELSGYSRLFDDLEACIVGQSEAEADLDVDSLLSDDEPPRLRVHEVGAFVASYVPGLADFSRLDPQFRLPDAVWEQLPEYADWGFAVIQFRAGQQDVHPIALHFPRRWDDRIYFPTVHVHDGSVHAEAGFDHMLYYQGMIRPERRGAASERSGWAFAKYPTDRFVDVAAAAGVVDARQPIERVRYHGMRPNEDVWLVPAGSGA